MKGVERRGARLADEQDNPGGRVPPPLTYLLTLLLALVLDRRFHAPVLPHGMARVLGWPLVGGGMALATWFIRTMRGADTTLNLLRNSNVASNEATTLPFFILLLRPLPAQLTQLLVVVQPRYDRCVLVVALRFTSVDSRQHPILL